jgi:hypothetical protein
MIFKKSPVTLFALTVHQIPTIMSCTGTSWINMWFSINRQILFQVFKFPLTWNLASFAEQNEVCFFPLILCWHFLKNWCLAWTFYVKLANAIPVQVLIGPEVSRRWRMPGFSDTLHMKVTRLSALPLHPREDPRYSFLSEAESNLRL